jgi:hypothetical protein
VRLGVGGVVGVGSPRRERKVVRVARPVLAADAGPRRVVERVAEVDVERRILEVEAELVELNLRDATRDLTCGGVEGASVRCIRRRLRDGC